MDAEKKIAVLIDADNVSSKYIKHILDELSKYGTPTYKRIYGDWTRPEMNSWRVNLLEHSIVPMQQFSNTIGKNATDSAMIIDAMDILYSGRVDSFCIVSSDSDFTKLASRMREAGMYVIGMGEGKTPSPFISACSIFKYLEVLAGETMKKKGLDTKTTKATQDKGTGNGAMVIEEAIRKIVSETSDDDGWISLANVGSVLNKQHTDFDSRNYGFAKLGGLLKSFDSFDIEQRAKNAYIRNKEKTEPLQKRTAKSKGKSLKK